MIKINKVRDILIRLNFILTNEQKKYGVLIFILSILSALLEVLGVSVIIPLMQVLLSLDALKEKWYIRPFLNLFNIESDNATITLICIGVISVYIIKNLYFIFYTWVINKYAYKIKREISVRVLKAYIAQGYIFFVNNNSSRLLQGIGNDPTGVYNIINQIILLLSKGLTIICIGVFIIIQSPTIALYLLVLMGICLSLIQILFRKSMIKNGKLQRIYAWECNQTSIETIQGSKEIIVTGRQNYFVNRYEKSTEKLNKVSIKAAMGAGIPNYIIEMVCICGVLLVLTFKMIGTTDPYTIIGQLSAIAIAAFRILPALGYISSSINSISFNVPSLVAAYDTLFHVKQLEKENADKKIESDTIINDDIRFETKIILDKISFAYPNAQKKVLNNLNMTINKGDSIGLIGPSGAGKTTLSDIILSLLHPQEGTITMDAISIKELKGNWNRIVGYVPQMVYLVDDSIRNNVAFGLSDKDIDDSKVWKALEMAQLKTFVENLPDGLNARVGEWGIKFSGGQRQRIAIARALYNNPDILVLDEATASLDNDTERAVMEAIDTLHGIKTLIIVAHRLSTVKNCNIIYEIKDGIATIKSKNDLFGE